MFTLEGNRLAGTGFRLVSLGALVWGTVSVPQHYDHTQPAFVVFLSVAIAGWLVWLYARAFGRQQLIVTGCLVSGIAGAIVNGLAGGTPAVAFPSVTAGVLLTELPGLVGFLGAGLLVGATALALAADGQPGNGAGYALIVVVGASVGLGRGQQVQRGREAERLLLEERRTQAEREQNATLIERGRLAREIHDVLAHSLGALAIQLEVADAILTESRDVDAALPRVRQARRLAVEGLAEARSAVAALRTDAPPLPVALETLAEQTGATYAATGEVRPLSPEVTLALTRIATEALTNARKHAAGAAVSVTLAYAEADVTLRVTDTGGVAGEGSDGGGGAGLAGMKERLALIGGTLAAGPDGAGWAVVASVPA